MINTNYNNVLQYSTKICVLCCVPTYDVNITIEYTLSNERYIINKTNPDNCNYYKTRTKNSFKIYLYSA